MSRKSSKSNAANDAQEKYSAEIREFQTAIPENKKCFECDQRKIFLHIYYGVRQ